MTPYFQNTLTTIYLGDCREIISEGDSSNVELLLTDPPYGISVRTDRKSRGRGRLAESNDFQPVYGDDQPFDPVHLLVYPRIVLFGANYYTDKLPISSAWIVWDKVDGLPSKRKIGFCDSADCEMAWTNLGGPARILHHRWMGMMKGSEHKAKRCHPTQKPIALMEQIIEWRCPDNGLILDPYMGAGSTLIAAQRLGHKSIGCEIVEEYCEIAAKRLEDDITTF